MLKNLESLTLANAQMDISETGLFSECINVVNLDIHESLGAEYAITQNDFPNLEYLRIDNFISRHSSTFQDFLMNRKKLKTIFIDDNVLRNINWITDIIVKHVHQVERITIRYSPHWSPNEELYGQDPPIYFLSKPLTKLRSIGKIQLHCEKVEQSTEQYWLS